MQSRLGIASFVIGIAVGVAYVVIRILLPFAPNAITVLNENFGFLLGASVAGVVGLVLGILGWVRAQKADRKTGLAIIGSALGAAVTVWAIVTWILSFTQQVNLPTT